MPKSKNCCSLLLLTLWLGTVSGHAQQYELRRVNDTLYYLNEWRLPYPVYQFQTGDVDGNGQTDCMVGVIKKARFHREKARRLFIFKQVKGKVRPLWLGSRLGGTLHDFRYVDGYVRCLETYGDSLWAVTDYQWDKFGMDFARYIVKDANEDTAIEKFWR